MEIKYKYLNILLNYSIGMNIFSYIPLKSNTNIF